MLFCGREVDYQVLFPYAYVVQMNETRHSADIVQLGSGQLQFAYKEREPTHPQFLDTSTTIT